MPDVRQFVPDQRIEQFAVAPAHRDRGRQHDTRAPGRPVTDGIVLADRAPLDAGHAPDAGLGRQLGQPAASFLKRAQPAQPTSAP